MKLKVDTALSFFHAPLTRRHSYQKLTCSALLLICSVLTVLLSVASPWQRNTFTGRPSTVELLRWTRLSACCEGVEVKNSKERKGGRNKDGKGKGKKLGEMQAERDTEGRQGESNERWNREEAKERERRDSQSMKQFDNLVILLLESISPEGPAIK